METLSYFNVKYTPRVSLILLAVEKIKLENSIFFFLLFLMHNSKHLQRIRTIGIPNDCSIMRDYSFLGQSCMQAKIGELRLKTHVTDFYTPFCVYLRTQLEKYRSYKQLYLTNDYSTIGDIYFLGQNCMQDTIGELWIQTFIQPLFDMTFCAYLHP